MVSQNMPRVCLTQLTKWLDSLAFDRLVRCALKHRMTSPIGRFAIALRLLAGDCETLAEPRLLGGQMSLAKMNRVIVALLVWMALLGPHLAIIGRSSPHRIVPSHPREFFPAAPVWRRNGALPPHANRLERVAIRHARDGTAMFEGATTFRASAELASHLTDAPGSGCAPSAATRRRSSPSEFARSAWKFAANRTFPRCADFQNLEAVRNSAR